MTEKSTLEASASLKPLKLQKVTAITYGMERRMMVYAKPRSNILSYELNYIICLDFGSNRALLEKSPCFSYGKIHEV
jgi:hypothetical protein